MYKVTHSNKMKKLWFKLVHKDLYYYKNKEDSSHRGMHNLSGTYINEEEKFIFENEEYFCLAVIYPKKTRKYYTKEKSEHLNWIKHFQTVTEHSTITDIYEISVNIFLNLECFRRREVWPYSSWNS